MMKVTKKKRAKASAPSIAALMRGLGRRRVVTWHQIDPFLENGVKTFERDVKKLCRALDRLEVRVTGVAPEAPEYEAPYQFHASLRGDGALPYEQALEKLPRLSRVGEFKMARRYEFLRHRAEQALRAAGFPKDELRSLVLHGEVDLATPKLTPAVRRHARARLDELEELRNAFLEGSLYLVMKGVHKYRGLGIDTLDLIQEGNVSLFQAVEGFDWRRDVRFKTYAEYWINQAFLKMLYNNVRTVRIPVWVQKILKKIKDMQAEAVQRTGQELSHEEVGKRLNIPAEKVAALLKTQRYAVSLDAEVGGDDDGGHLADFLEDQRAAPVPEQIADVPLKERLAEVLNDLPERERMILVLRFGLDGKEPRTLYEVGQLLDVSAERVRQLQEVALRRLKMPKSRGRLQQFVQV